jgi:cardiolipin synthase
MSTFRGLVGAAIALGLAGCATPAAPVALTQTAIQAPLPAPTVTLTASELPTVTVTPFQVPAQPRRLDAPAQTGNEALLSVSPAETLPAVEQFIQDARHTLWIEMFELGGTYGKKIVPLILERARAGVDVRLLLDQVGSGSQAKGILPWQQELAAAGVQIVFYKLGLRDDLHGEHRLNITHRKLLLADGERAMEGGTNLGTDFDTTEQDLMVRWRGPILGDLYREFGQEWGSMGGRPLPVPLGPFAPAGDVDGQVLVTSTPEGRFEIRAAVFDQIDHATQEILCENQYLWDEDLIQHLLAALGRGVKVRVIVPGGTKEKLTLSTLNNTALHRLVQAGAQARGFYNPAIPEAHLHTKYFAVDGRWVCAGSANGDQRSFTDHQELDVASTQPAFVQLMQQRVFEADWARMSKPWSYVEPHGLGRPFTGLMDLVDYYF